jgi:hypothetical protein
MTLIKKPGEFYASTFTAKEAMDRGFRRSFRWNGAKKDPS